MDGDFCRSLLKLGTVVYLVVTSKGFFFVFFGNLSGNSFEILEPDINYSNLYLYLSVDSDVDFRPPFCIPLDH